MYESFWKLKEKPFVNTPDPRFLFPSPQHEDALIKLTYAIAEGMGAAMLTGVFGCGKTLVARAVLNELGQDKYKLAVISNPKVSDVELLRGIVRNLRVQALPEKKTEIMADSLLEILNNVLLDNMRDGKETVVLIDEAHVLEDESVFEELRMLLNFQTDNKFLLTLLLVGQPELKDKIANLKQFDQRVAIRCHLDKFKKNETQGYIQHRLKVAGREDSIFTKDAFDFIHDHSGGIPRRINTICDLSLLTGFGKKSETIDAELVKSTTEQFAPG
ncbi:MAG: AAA family ATPase [Candidatus Omnitrophica bacterium]|nr:AAA family ATPase [Candidatus Omnitrophota bacterium]